MRHVDNRLVLKMEIIRERVERSRLYWYGYVKRHEGLRRIQETGVDGRRPRGPEEDRKRDWKSVRKEEGTDGTRTSRKSGGRIE